MGKIQSISDLEDAIKLLEFKKAEEEKLLKEISHMTYESVQPINMIKNIFKESLTPQNMKDNLVNTSVGLGFGYLSKILFQSVVRVPFKKFIGSALMISVENLVAKNPEVVSAIATFILNSITKKSDKDVHKEVDNEFMDLETIY
ncbi:hypothetical protein [Lutibacter sp.]|uniref:hypothetical protein n=1 Tax=Lutibacter sp. TaxID=1925666 RepID=UPI003562A3BF